MEHILTLSFLSVVFYTEKKGQAYVCYNGSSPIDQAQREAKESKKPPRTMQIKCLALALRMSACLGYVGTQHGDSQMSERRIRGSFSHIKASLFKNV